MAIAVLYPRFDHPAIEERYASWQTQMRLRRATGVAHLDFYDPGEIARDVIADIAEPHVLVVTDPLIVPSMTTAAGLRGAVTASGADAAVPVSNEARHPRQVRNPPSAYLTLRELERVMSEIEAEGSAITRVTWDDTDPALYLCRADALADVKETLPAALRGRDVAIASSVYVHGWSAFRGQSRDDLLPYVPLDAHSLLELGCGEGALGALVKQRQKCRVAGIELDPDAAAVARKRLDDVYTGDARHIIEILDQRFDCIVASELIEHVDDPWSLLAELRHATAPGGTLVMSIPNIANAAVIGDLLHGRFDYSYIGLLCVGHLRFFTRRSIEELLDIAGWRVDAIVPQRAAVTPASVDLLAALQQTSAGVSADELLATGYYVVARNPPE
jgi:2-polyprenyl-3-methyl-5-hydroxy-6-metoxy-1,4-benzoquinol methylase